MATPATQVKVACDRCGIVITASKLVVHQRGRKCAETTLVAGATVDAGEAAGAAAVAAPATTSRKSAKTPALVTVPSDLSSEFWACRNTLRRVGHSGIDAIENIVALLALRALDTRFPEMSNPPEFFGDLRHRHELGAGAAAISNRRATFSQLLKYPDHDVSGENKADMIRGAFAALQALPAAAPYGVYFGGSDASMTATFSCGDGAAASELLRRVGAGVVYDASADTVGRAIQSVTCDLASGKDFGQFFTPPAVVDIAMSRAVSTYAAGTGQRRLGRVFDPTCGSGAFLLRADAGGADAIAGVEFDQTMHRLAFTNLVVGCRALPLPAAIVCGDVLAWPQPDGPRFDTVLANPPFGITGIEPDKIREALNTAKSTGARVYPLDSSATGFFMQRIIAALEIGGRGVVVLPDGSELAKSDPGSVLFRAALCHALDILEVVALPVGTFENTKIPTTIIVFDKRRELADVITPAAGRTAAAILPGLAPATARIALSKLVVDAAGVAGTAPIDGVPEFVDIGAVAASGWVFSPGFYRAVGSPFDSAYPMVPLGEVAALLKGKSLSSAGFIPGDVPVVGGGRKPVGTHSVANTPPNATIVSADGYAGEVSRYPVPVFLTGHAFELRATDPRLDPGFLHVVAEMCSPTFCMLRTGLGPQHLEREKALAVQVPLPPLDVQQAIAAAVASADAEAAALQVRVHAIRADARALAKRQIEIGAELSKK
jgi:predicted RNA methylase